MNTAQDMSDERLRVDTPLFASPPTVSREAVSEGEVEAALMAYVASLPETLRDAASRAPELRAVITRALQAASQARATEQDP